MQKTLLALSATVALLLGACTAIVNADRSKIPDNLYQPTATGGTGGGEGGAGGAQDDDAGQDAAPEDVSDAGDAAASEAAVDADLPDASVDQSGSG